MNLTILCFVFLLFGNSNQKCFCLVPWHRVLIHHYLPIYYLQTHLKILFLDGHDLNWSCPKARFGLLAFTVRWKYRNIFIGLLSKANFDVKYMDRAVKVKNMKKSTFSVFSSQLFWCFTERRLVHFAATFLIWANKKNHSEHHISIFGLSFQFLVYFITCCGVFQTKMRLAFFMRSKVLFFIVLVVPHLYLFLETIFLKWALWYRSVWFLFLWGKKLIILSAASLICNTLFRFYLLLLVYYNICSTGCQKYGCFS